MFCVGSLVLLYAPVALIVVLITQGVQKANVLAGVLAGGAVFVTAEVKLVKWWREQRTTAGQSGQEAQAEQKPQKAEQEQQNPEAQNKPLEQVRSRLPSWPHKSLVRRLGAVGVIIVVLGLMVWSVLVVANVGAGSPLPETDPPVSLVPGTLQVDNRPVDGPGNAGARAALPEPLISGPDQDALITGSPSVHGILTRLGIAPVRTLHVSFTVRGNRRAPVGIIDVRPEIIQRSPVLSGTLLVSSRPGANHPLIDLISDLDTDNPQFHAPDQPAGIPWRMRHQVPPVAKDETQQFFVTFFARLRTYFFRIVLTYEDGNHKQGTLTILSPAGGPFVLTGEPPDGKYGVTYWDNYAQGGGPGMHLCRVYDHGRCAG